MNNDRVLIVMVRTFWIGAAMIFSLSLGVELFVTDDVTRQDLAEVHQRLRYGLLMFSLILAGGYRAAMHPFFDRKYARWLDAMPWATGNSLPLRRIVFGWMDGALLLIAMGLQWSMNPELMWDMPIVMLLSYLAVSMIPCVVHRKSVGMYTFGLSVVGALLLLPWPPLVCAVLAVAYLVVIPELRHCAVEHVWAEPLDDGYQPSLHARLVDYRREFALIKYGVGFPYSALNKLPQRFAPVGWHKLGLSVWVGLIVYAMILRVADNPHVLDIKPAMVLIGILAFPRLLAFFIRGESPVSLWGRIRTGRFIIPGHDVIFVGPLLAAFSGMMTAFFATHLTASAAVGASVGIAVLLFVSLSVGPSLHDWTLTGACRLREMSGQDTMVERI